MTFTQKAPRSLIILAAIAALGIAWAPMSALAARHDGQIGPTKYDQDGKAFSGTGETDITFVPQPEEPWHAC